MQGPLAAHCQPLARCCPSCLPAAYRDHYVIIIDQEAASWLGGAVRDQKVHGLAPSANLQTSSAWFATGCPRRALPLQMVRASALLELDQIITHHSSWQSWFCRYQALQQLRISLFFFLGCFARLHTFHLQAKTIPFTRFKV